MADPDDHSADDDFQIELAGEDDSAVPMIEASSLDEVQVHAASPSGATTARDYAAGSNNNPSAQAQQSLAAEEAVHVSEAAAVEEKDREQDRYEAELAADQQVEALEAEQERELEEQEQREREEREREERERQEREREEREREEREQDEQDRDGSHYAD